MARVWKKLGMALISASMIWALGCARLEPVEDASELAVAPEPATPQEEPKSEELIPLKLFLESKPISYMTDTVLKERAIKAEDEALRLLLSKTGSARVLLNQINSDLRPRYYQTHEETIYVIQGHGIMIIGEDRYVAKPGAVFVIPRNTIHSLLITGAKPLVALVVQTPPPLGGDMVFAKARKEQ